MIPNLTNSLRNRSVTQAFLFSSSEEPAIVPNSDVSEEVFPDPRFSKLSEISDMYDRESLIHAVSVQMAHAPAFHVLSVDVEAAVRIAETPEMRGAAFVAAAMPISEFRRRHNGVWGRIDRFRFACALTHDSMDGMALARELLDSYEEAGQSLVMIGVAVYPTLNDSRGDIVENANKALDHGTFFGVGTITRFDAVTLNISGDRCYQGGDMKGAMEAFKKGLRLDPMDANLHNSLGVCYGIQGDVSNAMNAFETAIWLAPEDVMAVYNKGYLLLGQGETDAALACFLKARSLEPDVFEVMYHIGLAYMETGKPDLAHPFLESAVRINSRSAPAAALLGRCLEARELTKEAIQAYKQAVKINPGDASSLSALGYLYASRDDSLDVAAIFCEQSVDLAPENSLFYHRLGRVYLKQDRVDDALAAFAAAQRLGYDNGPWIEIAQERRMSIKAS